MRKHSGTGKVNTTGMDGINADSRAEQPHKPVQSRQQSNGARNKLGLKHGGWSRGTSHTSLIEDSDSDALELHASGSEDEPLEYAMLEATSRLDPSEASALLSRVQHVERRRVRAEQELRARRRADSSNAAVGAQDADAGAEVSHPSLEVATERWLQAKVSRRSRDGQCPAETSSSADVIMTPTSAVSTDKVAPRRGPELFDLYASDAEVETTEAASGSPPTSGSRGYATKPSDEQAVEAVHSSQSENTDGDCAGALRGAAGAEGSAKRQPNNLTRGALLLLVALVPATAWLLGPSAVSIDRSGATAAASAADIRPAEAAAPAAAGSAVVGAAIADEENGARQRATLRAQELALDQAVQKHIRREMETAAERLAAHRGPQATGTHWAALNERVKQMEKDGYQVLVRPQPTDLSFVESSPGESAQVEQRASDIQDLLHKATGILGQRAAGMALRLAWQGLTAAQLQAAGLEELAAVFSSPELGLTAGERLRALKGFRESAGQHGTA